MALTVGTVATFVTENTGVFYTATVATSGSNRGLLVFVATTSQATPHNMRYNGVTMTQEIAAQEPDTGKRIAIWSLVAPASGSNTLAMSFSAAAAMALTALPLVDVDQTDFVNNPRAATGSAVTAGGTGYTSTATEVVFDTLSWAGTTAAVGAQQTQLSNIVSGGSSIRNAASYESGSAAVSPTWSLGAATNWIAAAVSCKSVSADPISQGPTGSPISLHAVANAQTDNTGTSYVLSASASGSARGILVLIANSSQALPHGVQFSSTALTREGFTQEVPSGKYISIWSGIAPPAGDNPLTISFSAAVAAAVCVLTFKNVDQFDMVGGYVGGSQTSTLPLLSASAQAGDLLVDGLCFDTGVASTTDTTQNQRAQLGNATAMLGVSTKPGVASGNIVAWSLSQTDDWAYGVVNVKPHVEKAGKASTARLQLQLARHRQMMERDFYTFIQQPLPDNVSSASASTGPVVGNTGSIGARISLPPQSLTDDAQWKRQAQAWMTEAYQGHLANTGVVTLEANAASTTVVDDRVGANSFIGLMPRTANAASEQASGNLYVIADKQSFTIAHTNNAQTDRIFTYSILG